MELGKDINLAISEVATGILAQNNLYPAQNAVLGANIQKALQKLAIAIIEKARESTQC